MASIRREVVIDATPERVWDALRDVGTIHIRLAPGFVADVVRERIVDVDEAAPAIASMIEQGLGVIQKTLGKRA